MKHKRLGAAGPCVSVVGLGASHFGRVCDREQSRAVVDAALECGITFIDTAEAYAGSEEMLGYALRGRRRDVVVSSKFGHPWTHRGEAWGRAEVVRTSLEGTLRRLQTDYLDCYLLHMPDPLTPIGETLCALFDFVEKGLVRYVGVSNFSATQIAEALDVRPLTCVQNRYNLLERDVEGDILPLCRARGLALVPAAPLASGLLTGRYHRGEQPRYLSRPLDDQTSVRIATLERCAKLNRVSLVEFAIGWLASQPCVGPVITGATTPDQIRANAHAADWHPAMEDTCLQTN